MSILVNQQTIREFFNIYMSLVFTCKIGFRSDKYK